MKIEPAVKKETGIIALGVAVMSALMVGIFALTGHFDSTVLWGAMLGAALAVGNFFLMGLSVQRAADKMHGVKLPEKEESEDEDNAPLSEQALQAKRLVQLSYHGRMLLCILVMIAALVIPVFNIIAAAIPLLFPRLIIMGQGIVQKAKEDK